MTPAEARECALGDERRGAARRRLLAPAAQRPRPRPGPAAGADDRRPRRQRGDRAASRWRRRCSCGGGTTSERAARPAPTACAAPGCSPTSRPTSRRSRPGRPARARRSCCGSPTRTCSPRSRRRSRRRCWRRIAAVPERRLAADLAAAECWACCRHDPLYPGRPARRRRRALGADRPRRPGAAGERLEPRRGGDRRRRAAGQHLRPRGRPRAGPRAGGGRAASSSAASPSASTPAPTAARSRPAARSPCSAAAPTSPTRPRTARSGGGSASAGLVLSELPPGTGAWRWTFPARNRIMAALAGMTVVVEAAERSGSLITADLAADLGRDLGAVPGPVSSRASAGPQRPARRRRLRRPRRPGRARRDARARASRTAERRGPRWTGSCSAVLAAVERGAETCDAIAAELDLIRRRGRRGAGRRSRPLGYVSCSLLGVYSRTLLPSRRRARHLGCAV